MTSKIITSIICIKSCDFSFYRKRLDFRQSVNLEKVETIIIDDASPKNVGAEIKAYCEALNYQYFRTNGHEDDVFSLSRSRNLGIKNTLTDFIIFEDADLVFSNNFYCSLEKLSKIYERYGFLFITVPAIYLKENISTNILRSNDLDLYQSEIILSSCIENYNDSEHTNQNIESYAAASSVILLRTGLAKAIGGFNEDFEGWGGEDRDFIFKLLSHSNIEHPPEFSVTKSWNLNSTSEFKGWRSLYKIMGDITARHGIYAFHLYHERNNWRSNTAHLNIKAAANLAKEYTVGFDLNPCVNQELPKEIIIGKNPHIVNIDILSNLKNPEIIDINKNMLPEVFADNIVAQNPKFCIMWNPFGNKWLLDVYRILQDKNILIYVTERGALPDSFYFDAGGFCSESNTYKTFETDFNLSPEKRLITLEYINNLKNNNDALEKQSPRLGKIEVKRQLKIKNDTKVFFIPFQVPFDTTVTQFIEDDRTYKKFILSVQELANNLPSDWIILYKNHPLSPDKIEIHNAINVDHYHINDLLETSHAVGLFNSGVGVLSMVFGKHVFYWGKCFYALKGVNTKWISSTSVLSHINTLGFDTEVALIFIHNLIHNFYSFAKTKYINIPDRKYRVLTDIKFSKVLIGNIEKKNMYYAFKWENSSIFSMRNPFQSNSKTQSNGKISHIQDKVYCEKLIRPIIAKFTSEKKMRKFDESPYAFFNDSKSKLGKTLAILLVK